MTYLHKSRLLLAGLALLLACTSITAAEKAGNSKKLKIVFMMGQSNMVGYSRPGTAWYLTQPAYVPPHKMGEKISRFFNWDHYWSGVRYALGSEEYMAKGKELIEERAASRKLWRSRIFGNFSRQNAKEGTTGKNWNYKEWGDPPHVRGINNREFLDIKAEEEGIYKRIEEYIESPENKFHPKVAIAEIAKRDGYIAEDIKRVREIFLKGTKPEDFDRLAEALKDFGKVTASNRVAYTELVREKINLPIAKRTRITAIGEVSDGEANGILSLGYAKWADACGTEYPFGISFERMVDGPVLIVKVAVGGTSLQGSWRPPSLANTETPIEKAEREAEGREKNVKVGPMWTKAMEHIKKVLADPGKFHPDYDPKAGFELVGLVWFQGWNDSGNKAYGEQFVHFIQDFRKAVNAPDLPVVTGLMGHGAWKQNTFSPEPNKGMLYAAKQPELKGTVDIVNTLPYMPVELGFTWSVPKIFGKDSKEGKLASTIKARAICKDGIHYFGSAKFVYLTGDAMARELANLMNGGEPTIFKEAAEILGDK